jgi:hypothetical protein
MKHGDTVCFQWNGQLLRDAKFLGAYDFKNAVRVERSGLDYIIESKDVKTMEQVENERALKAIADARLEYGDIIDAWNKGLRQPDAIAEATNTPPLGIASRIRAAKRRGLLK